MEKSDFIKYLEDDAKEEKIFDQVEIILNIVSAKEELIIPKESTSFGAEFSNTHITSFKNTKFYQTNKFNFKNLYDQGRLMNCIS